MKSLRIIPVLLAGAAWLASALPGAAQHPGGGARAGVGAAAHSGFASPVHGPMPTARLGPSAGLQAAPASRGNGYRSPGSLFPPPGVTSTRPVTFSNGIARYGQPSRRGERGNRSGAGIVSFGYPGYLAFGYDPEFLEATENPNNITSGYAGAPEPDAYAGPQPYPQAAPGEAEDEGSRNAEPEPAVQPSYVAAPARARPQAPAAVSAPLPEEEAVTIIFRDGRPPEQIHNYALTRTALYITAGRVRTIPIDQIDLVATEKINEKAGVEFHLPSSR